MDEFTDSFLEWDDDEIENNQKEKWIVKHHIMLLIDASQPMFNSFNNTTFFSMSIDICKNLIIQLIKKNRNDKIGIMLFGTNDQNNMYPKYLNVLNEPKKPSIEMIKTLDNLATSNITNPTLLTTPLADALWYSSYLIKKCNENQSCSTIMLITCNDQPNFGNPMKQFNLRKKLDDVIKNNIDFKLIPIGATFNMKICYEDILSNFNHVTKPTHGLENVNDIMSQINEKIKHGRSVSKIKFFIDNESYISTSLYNFYTRAKIPAKVRLDKKNNKQLTRVNQIFTLESNEPLLKSDLGKYVILAQQKIVFKNEDILVLKSSIIEPGIRLLGFTDKNNIFITYHYKTSTFIRPEISETNCTLFNSLLESCMEMNKAIMCFIKVRKGGRVHLAALIPQDEIIDENGIQKHPSGFHCMYLPFLECTRNINLQKYEDKVITDQQVQIAKSICEKMYIDYYPALIKNPKLNCHWALLEVIALELEAPTILDETLPANNVIDTNLSTLKHNIITHLFPHGYNPNTNAPKKRLASKSNDHTNATKKTK